MTAFPLSECKVSRHFFHKFLRPCIVCSYTRLFIFVKNCFLSERLLGFCYIELISLSAEKL